MTRCKLISPTNLMLERPMISPVKETEFILFGVREYGRQLVGQFWIGFVAGMCFSALLVFIFVHI